MQNHGHWQIDDCFPEPIRVGNVVSDEAGHSQHLRSPLGQLIERSKSSPSNSTAMYDQHANDSFVGTNLLDYVTNSYNEISLNRSLPQGQVSLDLLQHQRGSDWPEPFDRRTRPYLDDYTIAPQQTGVLVNDIFPIGGGERAGTSGPSRFGGKVGAVTVSTETSVDGSLSPFPSFEAGSRYRGFMESSMVSPATDIERSHLAPVSLIPSRGSRTFGPTLVHQDSLTPTPFDRQTVSVGHADLNEVVFGTKTATRFLLDDVTPDNVPRRSASMGPQMFAYNNGVDPNDLSNHRSSSARINRLDRGSRSPLTPQGQTRSHASQIRINEFDGGAVSSFHLPLSQDFLARQQNLQSSMPPSQQDSHEGPASLSYRHAMSVEPSLHGAAYGQQQISHQPHILVHTGQQFQQQQQQIYVGSHSTSSVPSHGSQTQALQLQGLQVLSNGQTVFVSTAVPPQQSYTNSTMLYHPQLHPQHHHNGASGQRDEYVSLTPIQRGNQHVTYWQSDGATLYPSNGLIKPGSGPIMLNELDNSHDYDGAGGSHSGGRSREPKNGRGRRGNLKGRGGDSKSSVSSSSMRLEEFRSSKSRDWTVRRIEGHIVEFCQDQNGSRFIQQRLEMGDMGEQQVVMKELLPAIRRLRNDVFGNYVVQKLLDFGSPKTKQDIRDTLEGEILPLSLQMYGCRVVQKALETLDEGDLPRMLGEFHNNVLSCIQDQNGNHVIQKCIEVLNSRARNAASKGDSRRASFLSEQVDFVIDDVLANTTLLSCHPYGCRVLQRILEHCLEKKKLILLDEIKKCHKTLLDDQYGNYVIQHVLQYGREEDRDSIVDIVVENGLLGLSRQKFASNVVEKLLKYGNGDQRRAIVREMLKYADDRSVTSDPGDGHTIIVLLMVRDAYANYVVQTTLDVVPESEEKRLLLRELNSHTDELRNYTFAKHIVAKLHSMSEGNGNNS